MKTNVNIIKSMVILKVLTKLAQQMLILLETNQYRILNLLKLKIFNLQL